MWHYALLASLTEGGFNQKVLVTEDISHFQVLLGFS